jgi:hypothetical protein
MNLNGCGRKLYSFGSIQSTVILLEELGKIKYSLFPNRVMKLRFIEFIDFPNTAQ